MEHYRVFPTKHLWPFVPAQTRSDRVSQKRDLAGASKSEEYSLRVVILLWLSLALLCISFMTLGYSLVSDKVPLYWALFPAIIGMLFMRQCSLDARRERNAKHLSWSSTGPKPFYVIRNAR